MSVIKVDKSIFEEKVLKSDKPVLLDFYADWCAPCRMVAPIVEEIADEYPQFFVGKINVDGELQLAQAFGIESIPTLVAIKDGKAVNQLIGVHSKEEIIELLNGLN